MDAIKKLFGPEIDAQSISIATVREKICLDPILCNEDAKKVYDKIRAQWRYKAQVDNKPSTASLPSEKDTVSDRVERECSKKLTRTKTMKRVLIPPTLSPPQKLPERLNQAYLVQPMFKLCFVCSKI